MLMRHKSGSFALVLFLASSCSSLRPSIVKKPEIQNVKKVAIISVTAPQRVPHKSGRGEVKGWDKSNSRAISDQIYSAYVAEFKKLGWEIVPAAQLGALPAYQENFAPKLSKANNGFANTLNKLSSMDAENMYLSPTGLFPVVWAEEGKNRGTARLDLANLSLEKDKALKTKMQEVASKAGADAAVLVQADYCYDDGSVWVGRANSGSGSAVLTGASAVYAVTPKGVEVIKMARIPASCGGQHRAVSDSSTPMAKGYLLFGSDKIQKMFSEVAQKCAADNVKQIQNAIKD